MRTFSDTSIQTVIKSKDIGVIPFMDPFTVDESVTEDNKRELWQLSRPFTTPREEKSTWRIPHQT